MLVLKSNILNKYPDIVFGFSTKIDENSGPPFYFNLSASVGDDREKVLNNRKKFYASIGQDEHKIAFQNQVHGNEVRKVESPGYQGESDAMITEKRNIGLVIGTADCTPIFIYDPQNKIIGAVHSGWRSTEKKIVTRTMVKMNEWFNCKPENLIVYLGPSISQKNYEVDEDVARVFDEKYLLPKGKKYLLDVAGNNYDMLIDFGVPAGNIQKSKLCSYENKNLLHSYRRDGKRSGRAVGVIGLKG